MATLPRPEEQLYSQANCWACNILVHVPEAAKLFKCGWCGAVNNTEYPSPTVQGSQGARKAAFNCLRWAIVGAVVFLIQLIALPGLFVVMPAYACTRFSQCIHFPIGIYLFFIIMFNYIAAVRTTPGTVAECKNFRLPAGVCIPKDFFADFRYCYECHFYKPPDAHHCRACGKCIVDMDHHCPFINNCVGRANLRNFVLFLFWACLTMVYVMFICGSVLYNTATELHIRWARWGTSWEDAFQALLSTLLSLLAQSPVTSCAAFVLFALACGVFVALLVLLIQQLVFIVKGTQYVATLQHGYPTTNKYRFANILRALGCQSMLGLFSALLWPSWGPPPGVLVVDKKSA